MYMQQSRMLSVYCTSINYNDCDGMHVFIVCDAWQAQLKDTREELLRKACPALTDELISAMKRSPMRSYDPSILKEPHIYR